MAGKPRAADAARSKSLSQAVLRLRNSRRARLQCCAAFTIVAAAVWLTRRLWRDRVAGLLAAEQVHALRRCFPANASNVSRAQQHLSTGQVACAAFISCDLVPLLPSVAESTHALVSTV